MQYTLACNWDKALLEGAEGTEAKSLFGGIPNSFIPGGRASVLIPEVNKEYVEDYVKECHDKDLEFTFLMNGSCMDNLEYTRKGYHSIMRELEWISGIGVDRVVITLPFLIELVVKHFPNLKVEVSSYQKIDSVTRAKRFEDMGVGAIMLSEHVNRNFKLLEGIRKGVDCEIILLGNLGCLYGCPSLFSHANLQAHASQAGHCTEGFVADGYILNCTTQRLINPVEFIRTRWIRPNDVHYYEEVGIDAIKIIERQCTTEALLKRLGYYSQQKYTGNLVDLLGQMPNRKNYLPANSPYLMREEFANVIQLLKRLSVLDKVSLADLIYVDNEKIPEDFLDYFKKVDCHLLSCEECRYCYEIAEQAISTDEKLEEVREKFKTIKDDFVMGKVF